MSIFDHRLIVAEAIKKDKFVRAFFLIDEKEKIFEFKPSFDNSYGEFDPMRDSPSIAYDGNELMPPLAEAIKLELI